MEQTITQRQIKPKFIVLLLEKKRAEIILVPTLTF